MMTYAIFMVILIMVSPLASVEEYETAQLMSAPKVVALPGQSFSVFMGRRVPVSALEGGGEYKDIGYTLEGTVARSEDGNGFSIRSRVERVEQGEATTGSSGRPR